MWELELVVPFLYCFVDVSRSTVCMGQTAATKLWFCIEHVGNGIKLSLSIPCAHRREGSLET